jgi:hypothetical protein
MKPNGTVSNFFSKKGQWKERQVMPEKINLAGIPVDCFGFRQMEVDFDQITLTFRTSFFLRGTFRTSLPGPSTKHDSLSH